MVMFKTFLLTLLPLLLMCTIVHIGFFDNVPMELGNKYYAEIPSMLIFVPNWMTMPFNTLVNFGYAIVGAMWLAITSNYIDCNVFTETQSFLFYIFNWMALFYSPIQLLRILTQIHAFAVLDQWVTLPFFMWVVVEGITILYGWNWSKALCLCTLSILSYFLVLLPIPGFEISLILHIAAALHVARLLYNKFPNEKSKNFFIKAFISCLGFIFLKLLDLHLGNLHLAFKYLSGHFLSKICDILQIHYVNLFVLNIVLRQNKDAKKKAE
ncbi:transmembrane protein 187 [Octopus bimaculoides]|uniref:Transmembrane protein 187 n=1 Tax=Octopus bimaculoides TaxID=37653 RepID=A0A0L8I1C1_OCTBM|nr:transmembrane protein 187 [Octopus bimaculoides]XP_014767665.1 transmembrane protein 187 [Octopus bimaculoides]XP_014767666.1 transmembrane protein 187 [Octopus bimaculoides]|eukprot:XP_014767664.1 PREDICTED: transmembrane protein 187-like [Octopus bimaculoides]